MKHLSLWRNKTVAMATNPKMMPWQHIGSGSSQRYRCKRRRADVRNMLEMVGCSRLPGSHGTATWQTRDVQRPLGHGANIWYISYMQGHLIAVVSGYTFEAFRRDGSRFVEGSSRSRVVVEVVVHGVVEVVVHVATVVVHVFVDVHVDGSGTRDVGVLVGPVLAV